MAVTTSVFQGIGGTIDNATAAFVTNVSSDMIATITPWAISGAALYFTLYGYLIIAGKVQQPFGDFLVKSTKIALIGALALNAGNYLALVVETLTGLEAALEAAVGSGGTGTIYGTLDATLGQGMELIAQCMQNAREAGWTELTSAYAWYVCAVLIAVGLTLVVVVGGIAIVMSTMLLKILFAIGPLFIMALLFPVTARFFDQWIGYVLNHILIVVLTATVLTLGVMIYEHELAKVTVGTGDQNMALIAFELLIIAGILYAIVKGVAGMASALAGGLSMAVLSIGQMTGAARSAAAVGKGAGQTAGKTIAGVGNLSGWVGGKAFQAVNALKGGNSVASSPQPAYRAGLRELMQKQNRPARS